MRPPLLEGCKQGSSNTQSKLDEETKWKCRLDSGGPRPCRYIVDRRHAPRAPVTSSAFVRPRCLGKRTCRKGIMPMMGRAYRRPPVYLADLGARPCHSWRVAARRSRCRGGQCSARASDDPPLSRTSGKDIFLESPTRFSFSGATSGALNVFLGVKRGRRRSERV